MENTQKKLQLKKHKMLATGLFILMALVFIAVSIAIKSSPAHWMYYVRAFSEAAMVGALADWFAVTALFHHPLGLKIPHTNLIEQSKESIGNNLGQFVVDNFLTPQTLKPYMAKLDLAQYASIWLASEKNRQNLTAGTSQVIKKIVLDLDDQFVTQMMAKKGGEFIHQLNANELLGSGINYLIQKGLHNELISFLADKLKIYIAENEALVHEKVKEESSILIPGFVDNIIAKKITNGLSRYFDEIAQNEHHKIRADIADQLSLMAHNIKVEQKWHKELQQIKLELIKPENTQKIATELWTTVKGGLLTGLEADKSAIKDYLGKAINDLSLSLQDDENIKNSINKWIRLNAFKLALKNRNSLATLISNTIGNWQGRDLSEKLELEVGKDLQFIRINGTIVGGIVGVVIYTITQLFH